MQYSTEAWAPGWRLREIRGREAAWQQKVRRPAPLSGKIGVSAPPAGGKQLLGRFPHPIRSGGRTGLGSGMWRNEARWGWPTSLKGSGRASGGGSGTPEVA